MEKRYETPLKQPSVGSGNVMVQTGHGIQMIPQSAIGAAAFHPQGIIPAQPQYVPLHTRHNFYEIQNILHNEILLFK